MFNRKKYSGQIFYKKQNFKTINNKILNKKIQLVFQNPESSQPKSKNNKLFKRSINSK